MTASQLTVEDWRFISVLLAQDVNQDMNRGLTVTARHHHGIWQKIQPECEWQEEQNEPAVPDADPS